MCGRFTVKSSKEELEKAFDAHFERNEQPLFVDALPSFYLPVIKQNTRDKINLLKWGLIPSWAKDPKIGGRLINARAETIDEKPSFKNSFSNRRCLVLADAFYEWNENHKPFEIKMKNHSPFAFAGIYDIWNDAEGRPLETFSIITTTPNNKVGKIHDRMPVILESGLYNSYLNDLSKVNDIKRMLVPISDDDIEVNEIEPLLKIPRRT